MLKKGITPKEYKNPPVIPDGFEYIWEIFMMIHADRDSGWSIQPMKIRDIVGASGAVGLHLQPFEIELIRAIDREFVGAHNGHSKS